MTNETRTPSPDHCGIVEVDPADFTRIDARGLAMADARRMWTLAAATLERDIRLHDMTEDEERVMIGAVLSAAERHYEAQSAEIENLKHDVTRQMAIANEYVNEVEAQSATIERVEKRLRTEAKVMRAGADAIDAALATKGGVSDGD